MEITKKAGTKPFEGAAWLAWSRKWTFLAVFLLIFFTSTGVLGKLDLLPESNDSYASSRTTPLSATASVALGKSEFPTKIEIPDIGLEATVNNPTSSDVATLDQALLTGAVRYPSSSKLGEAGNVILFGHSSYLPVVRNASYKAFNDIQKLREGDTILVTGESRTYVYEVESVMRADAEADAIPLSVSGSKLTLATCDSFGEKSDRFVVVASLVESYPAGT